jgi:hypothetical protein
MSPNFLIAGPPKCASTSLYYYFSQHPQIFVSKVKETHFFTDNYEKGIKYYEKYFENAGNAEALGEATPAYCFLPFALDRIKACYPDIKLILCLRNPMERAFSHWLMYKDAGVEKASFREAIDINLRQMLQVNFENDQGAALWNTRRKHVGDTGKWIRIYIQPGMYASIIRDIQQRFGVEQVKYIFMDDLKNNFSDVMKELFTFLQVENTFIIHNKQEKNFYYNRKILSHPKQNNWCKKLLGIFPRQCPQILNHFLRSKKHKVVEKPKLILDDRKFLYDIYRSDIHNLEKLSGKDLSNWKL